MTLLLHTQRYAKKNTGSVIPPVCYSITTRKLILMSLSLHSHYQYTYTLMVVTIRYLIACTYLATQPKIAIKLKYLELNSSNIYSEHALTTEPTDVAQKLNIRKMHVSTITLGKA